MEVSVELLVISFAAGLLIPPIVEFIKAVIIPKGKRRLTVFLLSLFSSLAIGAIIAAFTLDEFGWYGILYTFAASEIAYGLIWKVFGLDDKLNKAITSGKK